LYRADEPSSPADILRAAMYGRGSDGRTSNGQYDDIIIIIFFLCRFLENRYESLSNEGFLPIFFELKIIVTIILNQHIYFKTQGLEIAIHYIFEKHKM